MTNTTDTKERILLSAAKVFADKSFDGARIDDIADTANITKSLIYYHFKSKDEILKTLIQNFMTELKKILTITKNKQNELSTTTKFNSYYFKFAQENKDLINIMLVEALKNDNVTTSIFNIAEQMIKSENVLTEQSEILEHTMGEFFVSLLPLSMYVCLQEKWCKHFKITKSTANQLFFNFYEKTHEIFRNNSKR